MNHDFVDFAFCFKRYPTALLKLYFCLAARKRSTSMSTSGKGR